MGWMSSHPDMNTWNKCGSCAYSERNEKMAISLQELNQRGHATSSVQDANLSVLLERINKVRDAYATPMVVTSGFRTLAEQMKINPHAPGSHHCTGEAVDILDRDGALNEWCKKNEALLETIGLWMEVRQGPWQHFQIVPPKSGHRWFNP